MIPRQGFWRWFWGEAWRTGRSALDSTGWTVRFIALLAAATACTGYLRDRLAGSGVSGFEEVTHQLSRLL